MSIRQGVALLGEAPSLHLLLIRLFSGKLLLLPLDAEYAAVGDVVPVEDARAHKREAHDNDGHGGHLEESVRLHGEQEAANRRHIARLEALVGQLSVENATSAHQK